MCVKRLCIFLISNPMWCFIRAKHCRSSLFDGAEPISWEG